MHLNAYLRRIGFAGTPGVDLASLLRLQRHHLEHIPYENFDVQFGRPLTLSADDAFTKLVSYERGGWCYEMNGLFGSALEAIGFSVMPMTGAVMRAQRRDTSIGNHLILCVDLDEPYLVDVGLGDGPIEPIPLREGAYQQGWRTMRLERLKDGWWRFHNDERAMAPSFDFEHRPADWDLLAQKCRWQQSNPDSRFVQNAICLWHRPDGIVAMVGRVLKTTSQRGITEHIVGSADEYVSTLAKSFGLQLPQAAGLWPGICRRHEELFRR